MTKPGPLLRDVMEELRQERTHEQRQQTHADSIGLVEEARAAFVDECEEVVSHDGMNFDDEARTSPRSTSSSTSQQATTHAPQPTPERPERIVQHRFTRRDNDPATAPRT